MSVDTLSLAKELRAARFEGEQAEAIAAAIGRSIVETTATKADMSELRAAGKADLAQAVAELRTDIARLDTKIESSTNKLLFWFIGTQFAIAGIIIALVKLLPAQG